MKKVSVIIPMKNVAPYIRDAIGSILVDGYESLEVLCIDDGSDDGTTAIVEAICDPRVRVIPNTGRGIAAGFNTGLAHATGDYLMRCDGDDLFVAGRIQIQVDWMERHLEAVGLCGELSFIWQDGREVIPPDTLGKMEQEATSELLDGRVTIRMPTMIYRTESLRAIGGCREFFETGEDDDLMMRLAEHGPVWYAPQHVYRARLRKGSITRTQQVARLRWFVERAREFQRERRETGRDQLDLGTPPEPPDHFRESRNRPPRIFGQELMISHAWRCVSRDEWRDAWNWSLRAFSVWPFRYRAYRHLVKVAAAYLRKGAGWMQPEPSA